MFHQILTQQHIRKREQDENMILIRLSLNMYSVCQALFGLKKNRKPGGFKLKIRRLSGIFCYIKSDKTIQKTTKKWPPSSPLGKRFHAIIYKFKHGVFDSSSQSGKIRKIRRLDRLMYCLCVK